MYSLNKFVGFALNPIVIGLAALLLALVAKRLRWALVLFGFVWLWLWTTPALTRLLSREAFSSYPPVRAEEVPKADAIVVLGGGMGAVTNALPYAEMFASADRVWHAARLWKAGRAPVVVASGDIEREATVPLLTDLGVPETNIIVEASSRNTEENAREVGRLVRGKAIVVTSFWHMRRSELMFRRYAPELEIVPAATDYEAVVFGDGWWRWFPNGNAVVLNLAIAHEFLGYCGYRYFR